MGISLTTGLLAAGVGADIGGAILGGRAANAQANAGLMGSMAANDRLDAQDERNRRDFAPWIDTGGDAMRRLAFLMGLTQMDPQTGLPLDVSAGLQQANPNQGRITELTNEANYLRDVLSGKNPAGHDGRHEWPKPPSNPQTIAQMQAVIQRNEQEISKLQGAFQSQQRGSNPELYKPFTADPGYEWRRSEGLRGIEQRAAAKGSLNSGQTLKALSDYNQNQATSEFDNIVNRLMGVAGLGQRSTAQQVGTGTAIADRQAENRFDSLMRMGDARASQYGTYANAANDVLGRFQDYFANRSGQRRRTTPMGQTDWLGKLFGQDKDKWGVY